MTVKKMMESKLQNTLDSSQIFNSKNQSVIYMKDIKKNYYMGKMEVEVLKDISITIEKGEFIAILGPSGSGKSTLMNIIGCIDTPTEGEYVLDGKNIKDQKEDELASIRNNKIGFIFQKFNLLPKYSALYNTEMPLLLRGENRKRAKERAKELLELVGLDGRIHHKPSELSGGQQQRVAIARALVGNPQLLLADEPTGNLDSKSGEEILQLFKNLNKEGNTIVMITHDLHVAKQASRIIHLKDGKISSEAL